MGILKRLTGQTYHQPTLFAVDTLANPSRSRRTSVKANKTNATYGRGFETPLAIYDPVTSSWKTYKDTYPWAELPSLEKLPVSGIASNGVLFPRQPLARFIDVIVSSLWPTPRASTAMGEDLTNVAERLQKGKPYKGRLEEALALWPTPVARGGLDGGAHSRATMKKLEGTSYEVPKTGQMNPVWVEWLMGFPEEWTDLKDLETQ